MNSGSLPGGSAQTSTEQARSSHTVPNLKRPEWLTFPPEEIAMLIECIAEIESAGSALLPTYNHRLLMNMKRILMSERPIRFSALQVSYLMKIRSEALPAVRSKLRKKTIVEAVMNVLENDLSHINSEMRNLEKERKAKLAAVQKSLSSIAGGLSVRDFAERAIQMYCKYPEIKIADILSLFGKKVTRLDEIPSEYKTDVWTGAICQECNDRIYVRDIESYRRSEIHSIRFCADCEVDHRQSVEKPIPFWKVLKAALASWSSDMSQPTARQKELDAMTYTEYLKTEEWAIIRRDAYARDGYKCRICGETKKLNVHHNHYPRRGTEQPWDLCVLCEDCHLVNHEALRLRRKRDKGLSKTDASYRSGDRQ